MKRVITYGLILPAVLYLVWCGLLYALQDRLVFAPEVAGPAHAPFDDRIVVLERPHENGASRAWFIPSTASSTPTGLVALFHGNAEIIENYEPFARWYGDRGLAVLLVEYRGYGVSDGAPSQDAIVDDAEFFVKQVLAKPEVDASKLVVHGRSLGGGVAMQVAGRIPPAAVVLQSTMTSLVAMSKNYFAPGFLLKHPFRSDHVARQLDAPAVIFHGLRDEVVPVSHGRALSKLMKDAVYVEMDADHNSLPPLGQEKRYWGQIEALLDRAKVTRKTE